MYYKIMKLLILLFAVALVSWPNLAVAQTHEQNRIMERLVTEIELTQEVLLRAREVLERASEVVNMAGDNEATLLLRIAWERQKWAADQVGVLKGQFHLRLAGMALTATQKAREQARNAIASIRRIDRNQGVVSRRLDRAEDLLQRANDLVREHPERDRLEEMLQTANNSLSRAREFYNNAQYRPALKLASQATNVAERMLRGSLKSGRDIEEFERRQTALNRYLEETKERLVDCDWVQAQLEAAEKGYFLALELADENHPRRAIKQLDKAKGLVDQAVRNCRGLADIADNVHKLENRLQRLAEAGEHLEGSQAEALEALLTLSREQIALVKGFAEQKQFDAAKISVQAALKAMNRAQRLVEGL